MTTALDNTHNNRYANIVCTSSAFRPHTKEAGAKLTNNRREHTLIKQAQRQQERPFLRRGRRVKNVFIFSCLSLCHVVQSSRQRRHEKSTLGWF